MIFKETPLHGAYIIQPDRIQDARGFFARVWCAEELQRHGLKSEIAQANIGFSYKKGTLRGLHFQKSPYSEVKLVRCTKGAIFDVIVDLRPESQTYKQWFGTELSDENRHMIYAPEGFAQGYLTLTDNVEMTYHTSRFFSASAAFGVRFDDPAIGIVWPLTPTVVSLQDRQWPFITV